MAAVLSEFVRQGRQCAPGRGQLHGVGPAGGPGTAATTAAAAAGCSFGLAAVLGLFGLSRRRRRREQAAEFERVSKVARDDVIALGEEIRALDLDVELPETDAQAKQHYGVAVECYQQAEQALERARLPEDLEPVSEQLEAGRWEMEAARARMEGRDVPERRPPCFFDPRHGPSVTDVEWAPPGGSRARCRPAPRTPCGSATAASRTRATCR